MSNQQWAWSSRSSSMPSSPPLCSSWTWWGRAADSPPFHTTCLPWSSARSFARAWTHRRGTEMMIFFMLKTYEQQRDVIIFLHGKVLEAILTQRITEVYFYYMNRLGGIQITSIAPRIEWNGWYWYREVTKSIFHSYNFLLAFKRISIKYGCDIIFRAETFDNSHMLFKPFNVIQRCST